MRRLTTMMASASAAALTTLAVTVAVPAIAEDAPEAGSDDGFAACLRDHGLAGAPDGAVALKSWLGERIERGDATANRALEACSPPKPGIAKVGPSEQELRSCLTDHGVELPGGDARALKTWVLNHGDDAANRDAMRACGMASVIKRHAGGACGKEHVVVGPEVPAERAKKLTPAESTGTAEDVLR